MQRSLSRFHHNNRIGYITLGDYIVGEDAVFSGFEKNDIRTGNLIDHIINDDGI